MILGLASYNKPPSLVEDPYVLPKDDWNAATRLTRLHSTGRNKIPEVDYNVKKYYSKRMGKDQDVDLDEQEDAEASWKSWYERKGMCIMA